MNEFYILLALSSAGLVYISVLWILERRQSRIHRQELDTVHHEKNQAHAHNEQLIDQVRSLQSQNKKLNELIKNFNVSDARSSSMNAEDVVRRFLQKVKLKKIMTKQVVTVDIKAPFSEVYDKMKRHTIRHLPVVDYTANNRLVGLITQRNLYKMKSPRRLTDGQWYYDKQMLNDIILEHVMERDVFTLFPDDNLGHAVVKMASSKYGCIPIVNDQRQVKGLITRRDVLKIAADIFKTKETTALG